MNTILLSYKSANLYLFFYMIILLPDLIDTIPDCNRRAWATMLVMSGSMVQYILRMVINNIGGTLPYEFFM